MSGLNPGGLGPSETFNNIDGQSVTVAQSHTDSRGADIVIHEDGSEVVADGDDSEGELARNDDLGLLVSDLMSAISGPREIYVSEGDYPLSNGNEVLLSQDGVEFRGAGYGARIYATDDSWDQNGDNAPITIKEGTRDVTVRRIFADGNGYTQNAGVIYIRGQPGNPSYDCKAVDCFATGTVSDFGGMIVASRHAGRPEIRGCTVWADSNTNMIDERGLIDMSASSVNQGGVIANNHVYDADDMSANSHAIAATRGNITIRNNFVYRGTIACFVKQDQSHYVLEGNRVFGDGSNADSGIRIQDFGNTGNIGHATITGGIIRERRDAVVYAGNGKLSAKNLHIHDAGRRGYSITGKADVVRVSGGIIQGAGEDAIVTGSEATIEDVKIGGSTNDDVVIAASDVNLRDMDAAYSYDISGATRPRWNAVIGGGPFGGVDLSSVNGQSDQDEAVADGTSSANAGDRAYWDAGNTEWLVHQNEATV